MLARHRLVMRISLFDTRKNDAVGRRKSLKNLLTVRIFSRILMRSKDDAQFWVDEYFFVVRVDIMTEEKAIV